MKFWDSSAVVALLVSEAGQKYAQRELEQDPAMVVWWGTRVECVSALVRRERDRSTDVPSSRAALAQLGKLGEQWHEVLPTTVLRSTAERILRLVRSSTSI